MRTLRIFRALLLIAAMVPAAPAGAKPVDPLIVADAPPFSSLTDIFVFPTAQEASDFSLALSLNNHKLTLPYTGTTLSGVNLAEWTAIIPAGPSQSLSDTIAPANPYTGNPATTAGGPAISAMTAAEQASYTLAVCSSYAATLLVQLESALNSYYPSGANLASEHMKFAIAAYNMTSQCLSGTADWTELSGLGSGQNAGAALVGALVTANSAFNIDLFRAVQAMNVDTPAGSNTTANISAQIRGSVASITPPITIGTGAYQSVQDYINQLVLSTLDAAIYTAYQQLGDK